MAEKNNVLFANDWINNNPNPAINMAGKKINMLTVLERADSKNGRTMWRCKCDCGKEIEVSYANLKRGQYSCGCATRYLISKSRTTHGKSDSRLFGVWSRMKERCYRKNHKSYNDYGGRGIKVCDEWLDDFMNFYNWAMANGYDEKAEYMKCTLDRIDVNGNYEPSNCRFVSMKEQCNNRRNNKELELNGEVHTIAEWADVLNMKYGTVWRRLKNGWSVEEALNAKAHIHKKYKKVCNIKTHYDEYRLVE